MDVIKEREEISMSKYTQALIYTSIGFGTGTFLFSVFAWAIETSNPLIWILIGIMVPIIYLQILELVK